MEQKLYVLLIEDDVALYEVWGAILRVFGDNEICWVTNARAAKAQWRLGNHKFDLVVSDIFVSGGETGIELWRQFRDKGMPFVFTSIIAESKFRQLFNWEASVPPFLPKPVNPEAARDVLANLLKGRGFLA